jgi:CRISPR-associated endonuclease/helicase Cas3
MKSITQTTATHILAKSDGERLGDHTIKDLNTSYRLLDNLPFSDERLRSYLQLAVAFHDVGKACEGFQQALKPGVPYWSHRHEIVSSVFAATLGLPPEALMAILTHHKDLSPDGLEDDKGCLHYEDIPRSPDDISASWIELIKEFNLNVPALRNDWTQICNHIKRPDLTDFNPLTQLSSLTDYRDWIVRRRQVNNIPFDKRYFASLLRGLLISSDHIASSGAEMPIKIPDLKTYDIISSSFLQRLHGYQELAMYKTGNLILRAPTGSGKTLAALFWGQTNQKYNGRLFYVLPTQASINAMYLRLREYFTGERMVGLLHSRVASSIYSMYEEGDLGSRLANQRTARMIKSLMKEMYYPVRVCTPHQILRYSLMGKGWEMMLSVSLQPSLWLGWLADLSH